MNIKVYYVGTTQPQGLYEINEGKVEGLLKTDEWVLKDKRYEQWSQAQDEFEQELIDLKGIGNVTAKIIIKHYSTKKKLYESKIEDLKKLLPDDDVELLIKKSFVKEEK